MIVGPWRKLSLKELMLLNCGVGEDWVPWTARRSNQSILKEISLEYSMEGLMLKLQYFGHLMQRTYWKRTWCWERQCGRRGRQRRRWLHGITTDSMDMSLSNLWKLVMGQGGLACCSPWSHEESDTTERLNWTELNQKLPRGKWGGGLPRVSEDTWSCWHF